MSFIKKIYQSLDFVGNRLKNVKVDTPTETRNSTDFTTQQYQEKKDFVANKEYVDQVSLYDSPTATNQTKSTIFDWVKNINNHTIKEVFDILLFPVIKPKYDDAKFESIDIRINSNIKFGNKYLIYNDSARTLSNHFKVSIQLNPGDRLSGVASQLIFKDKNNVELTRFTATSTSETLQEFEFDYQLTDDTKIIFERDNNSTNTVKQDSSGNSVPIVNPTWKLSIDVTDKFHDIIKFEQCYLFSDVLTDLNSPVTIVSKLYKKQFVQAIADTNYILDIAVPKDNISGELRLLIFDNSGKILLDTIKLELVKTSNSVTVDSIEYVINRYYLGYIEHNCRLYFVRYE